MINKLHKYAQDKNELNRLEETIIKDWYSLFPSVFEVSLETYQPKTWENEKEGSTTLTFKALEIEPEMIDQIKKISTHYIIQSADDEYIEVRIFVE